MEHIEVTKLTKKAQRQVLRLRQEYPDKDIVTMRTGDTDLVYAVTDWAQFSRDHQLAQFQIVDVGEPGQSYDDLQAEQAHIQTEI